MLALALSEYFNSLKEGIKCWMMVPVPGGLEKTGAGRKISMLKLSLYDYILRVYLVKK